MLMQVLHGDKVYIDGSQLADFKQVRATAAARGTPVDGSA
jgi:hypothetical protein